MFYEDFEVGETYYTKGRTITEVDLDMFSEISGVHSPLHSDEEYCRNTVYKKRIAHGPLILSISNGLVAALNLYEDSLVGLLQIEWKFMKPVFIGDTVTVKEVVDSKKETRSPDRGIVIFSRHIYNQHKEEVQAGNLVALIKHGNHK